MYVRGSDQSHVQKWVDTVHGLRYKDYQLVAPVATVAGAELLSGLTQAGTLQEVETVKEMAAHMERQGLQRWWRAAMGFVNE
ncbi:hypothetical protein A1O7_01555 [Cladophialophora yegresii CBS 114405]|uniref:Uncharacterized protein n=1 Tax=Cladophialophora yegresii CBS 114405 TaxID=1182544 RepID=W9X402_9EURO|nr:uncharacterized protein A1O7_01555 [Cladophialophora yegresii CBS 114405]EXJ65214.1 hypothetical protein A1O7_01555 [Cladophialophora yegresii CBS 114405]